MTILSTGVATEFINFSRASNATVTDSNGVIKWSRHNLLLASEQFDAASWAKVDILSTTANSTAAPNGTITADLIIPSATNQVHTVAGGSVSATSATYSVFVKASGYTKIGLREGATSGAGAAFDISGSGSVIGAYNAGGSTVSDMSCTALANGWFLLSCKISFASATTLGFMICALNPSYSSGDLYVAWTPNGTSGFHLWGAHLYRSDLGGMQANTSAYPMYNPTTAKNLLGFTESFDNAAWAVSSLGVTVTADTDTAPNGLRTADTLTFSSASYRYQNITIGTVTNRTMTFSVWLWSTSGKATIVLRLSGYTSGADETKSVITLTSTPTRYSVTRTFTSTDTVISCGLDNRTAISGDGVAGSVIAWGAQLSDSASLDPYTPNHFAAPSAAAYYGPRLDYDPVTLAAKGLLVEEQRTNLLLNSATLSTQNVTVTAVAHTLSFYGTGTVTLTGVSTAGPLVGTGAYPNRVTLTFTPTAGTLTLTVTGSVTQAQLEAGSFATSYIPTTSATVTRSADVAQVGTAAFPYSATEGTIVVNGNWNGSNSALAMFVAFQVDANNVTSLEANNTAQSAQLTNRVGGVNDVGIGGLNTGSAGIPFKAAGVYKLNDYAAVVNGGTVGTDTTGNPVTGVLTMAIGSRNSDRYLNGHIRQITYLPRRLTNAELQSRTA